ncbi:MAG: 4'-phosphopantetheinyl transferase superfamily protein, partial [Kiritimatiellae bacterium]|nr:4'-phosphopantetheinyl transferase superfamily protein [Kiritimatiellia bacterium]
MPVPADRDARDGALRTDVPVRGPFRAALWHQDAASRFSGSPEDWLSREELAEYRALSRESRRREWFAARVALKDLLVRDGVVGDPRIATVRKDSRGAPRIVVWDPVTYRYAEMACSVSHCAPFVLCAYSPARGVRVGADAERRTWRLGRLGRKFVSPADRMLEKDDSQGDETVLWSFKESLSKLLGTGWACGFRNLSCVETAPGECTLRDPDGNEYGGAYFWFGQHAVTLVWTPAPDGPGSANPSAPADHGDGRGPAPRKRRGPVSRFKA